MKVYLDFETRSEINIAKTGAWVYSLHPSTSVLCMAYATDGGEVNIFRPRGGGKFADEWIPVIDFFDQAIKGGAIFEAHNAFFEKSIWKNIMVEQYGWRDIPDEQWACSAALASAHSLPRALGMVGMALGLEKQKDKEGHRLMLKMSKPRKARKDEDPSKVYWHEGSEDLENLYAYCKDDVEAERPISSHLVPLNKKERQVWLLDQKINMRGVRVDIEAVDAAINMAERVKEDLNIRLQELTNGQVNAASEALKLKDWINSFRHMYNKPMKGVTKQDVIDTLAKVIPDNIREALLIRQAGSKSSVAKYRTIKAATAPDGRIRDLLMYCGAGTGRWAGRLVQPHNFPHNDFKGDLELYFSILKQNDPELFGMCYPVMETLSYCLRPCLIPSEGKSFFGGDYSAIEPRVLFWLAGQEDGLQMFREGQDIYVALAKRIYNDDSLTEEDNPEERALGKQAILGCGYNMGPDTFVGTCANYDIEISNDMAADSVHAYRSTFSMVPKLWKAQEKAAKQAIKTKRPVRCGKILWAMHKGFLYCKLPSGRCIGYYHPKIERITVKIKGKKPWTTMGITYMSMNSKTRQWERTSTYGGKLVENITQAIARDIMAEAMLRCEAQEYGIVLTVHDELIAESDQGTKEEFGFLMAMNPEWALDLPIEVKPWTGQRYLK